MSTGQVAAELGVDRTTVIRLIADGYLRSEPISDRPGAHRRIPVADFQRFVVQRGA